MDALEAGSVDHLTDVAIHRTRPQPGRLTRHLPGGLSASEQAGHRTFRRPGRPVPARRRVRYRGLVRPDLRLRLLPPPATTPAHRLSRTTRPRAHTRRPLRAHLLHRGRGHRHAGRGPVPAVRAVRRRRLHTGRPALDLPGPHRGRAAPNDGGTSGLPGVREVVPVDGAVPELTRRTDARVRQADPRAPATCESRVCALLP